MPAEPVVVELTRPIEAHGETLTKLTIREPSAADVMACGNPAKITPNAAGDGASLDMDPAVIGKMLVRLAGVPSSTVAALSMLDFLACQAAVMSFLQPPDAAAQAPGQSSIDTSTSLGSGVVPPPVSLRSVSGS